VVENRVNLMEEKPCTPEIGRTGTPAGSVVPKGQTPPEGTFDKLKGEFKSIMK
jgi:hypothetical protein